MMGGPAAEKFENLARDVRVQRALLADLLSGVREREREAYLLFEFAANCTEASSRRIRFVELLRHTGSRIQAIEALIQALGGTIEYRGQMSRLGVFRNHRLLEIVGLNGAVSPRLMEVALLEAVAGTLNDCQASWRLLRHLAQRLPSSTSRHAFERSTAELEPLEQDLIWAQVAWEEELLGQVVGDQEPLLPDPWEESPLIG